MNWNDLDNVNKIYDEWYKWKYKNFKKLNLPNYYYKELLIWISI
jgi:hypothetical protein